MPEVVLTTTAALACQYTGTVTTNAAPTKLVVGGKSVLLAKDVPGWAVAACKAQSGSSPSPCATVDTPTAGTATKLAVGDSAVLLATLSAPTVGSAVPHTAGPAPMPVPPPTGPLSAV